MNVQPSTSFVTQFDAAVTGLVGTVSVGIYQGDTAIQALSSASVNEISTTGKYEKTLTSPGTAGYYTIIWSLDGSLDADQTSIEDLLVTSDQAAAPSTSNLYVTADELKTALGSEASTFMDDDIDRAVVAASRAIDEATGRKCGFYPSTQTRYYTADCAGYGFYTYGRITSAVLEIDDLNTLTSVTVDLDGDGTYETTWTRDTDFYLDPVNALGDGKPYERIVLRRQVGRTFPVYDNGVQVVGSFGWSETPSEVRQYASLFAAQLLLRTRQAPFGVLMAGMEIGTSARLARVDPDFQRLIGHLVKPHRLIA